MNAGFESVYASHPIPLGAVRWSARRVTLIVKLTFRATTDGNLVLAPWESQAPLEVDRVDAAGEVLWPSDFAPYKPGCDVCVVGADVASRAGAARIAAGPLVAEAGPGDRLNARESYAADPTSAEVFELWTSGAVPMTRFHSAPPHLRTSHLAPPLDVTYERGATRLLTHFSGPWPVLSIMDRSGRRLAYLVPAIDFVGIEASAGRVVFGGRAVYDAAAAPLDVSSLVVELSAHPALAPSSHWHAVRIVEPSERVHAVDLAEASVDPLEGTVSVPASLETTISTVQDRGRVLPFGAAPSTSASSGGSQIDGPAQFAALRQQAPAPPAWDASEGTVVVLAGSRERSTAERSTVDEMATAYPVVDATRSRVVPAETTSAPATTLHAEPSLASAPPTKRPSVDETVVRLASARGDLLPFSAARDRVEPSPEAPSRAATPAREPPRTGWTDDGSGTRAAVVMPARNLPFRSPAATSGASRERAPTLGSKDLVARLRELDAPDAVPRLPVRATLAVELERWAGILDDPSPTGPLAALLHEGTAR